MDTLAPGTTLAPLVPDVVRAVERALATAFEDLTFMDTQAVSELPNRESGQVYARIDAIAPVPSRLTLQMSDGAIDACIDALYAGVDPTEAIRQDVVREMINTVAGLVMSNLTEDQLIRLGLPTSGKGEPDELPGKQRQHQADLGSVLLTIDWE